MHTQNFLRNSYFLPLIRTRTCVYQGVRNICFSGNFSDVLNELFLTSIQPIYCVKSVQIRSFFWSVFSPIRTRANSLFGHFSRSDSPCSHSYSFSGFNKQNAIWRRFRKTGICCFAGELFWYSLATIVHVYFFAF